jgi:hypothetical protein
MAGKGKVSTGAPYKSIGELCRAVDYVLLPRTSPSTSATSTTGSGVDALVAELKALRIESSDDAAAATAKAAATPSPAATENKDDDGPPIIEEPALDALGLRAFEAAVEAHLREHKFTTQVTTNISLSN